MKYAFVFPGQGSQRVGMGSSFRASSQTAHRLYETASSILGYDLAQVCDTGPAELLARTDIAQPALFVASCAGLEILRERCPTLKPAAVAGHSAGEYAALYASGSIAFEEGVRLVHERGMAMREAAEVSPGAMAAILGLDLDAVARGCDLARSKGTVVVANDNCPGQIVISGESDAVAAAVDACKELGARRAVYLPVSGGFHSPLMERARIRFRSVLQAASIGDASIPVVSNVTADYCVSAGAIRQNLEAQITGRVRWRESVLRLCHDGVQMFLEIGCGDVLSGLIRRTCSETTTLSVGSSEDVTAAMEAIANSEEGNVHEA